MLRGRRCTGGIGIPTSSLLWPGQNFELKKAKKMRRRWLVRRIRGDLGIAGRRRGIGCMGSSKSVRRLGLSRKHSLLFLSNILIQTRSLSSLLVTIARHFSYFCSVLTLSSFKFWTWTKNQRSSRLWILVITQVIPSD